MQSNTHEALIRLPEVTALTGLKRSSIYLRLKKDSPYADESFPRPVSLAPCGKKGAVGWLRSEILSWIRTVAASRQCERDLPKDQNGEER